jgi:hypothetical protein
LLNQERKDGLGFIYLFWLQVQANFDWGGHGVFGFGNDVSGNFHG